MGNNFPDMVAAKTAVNCLLSSNPLISTRFAPSFSIVHLEAGTKLRPVWSQLKIRSKGIFSNSTVVLIYSKNVFFKASKLSGVTLKVVVPLRLTYPILDRKLFVQLLFIDSGPPLSSKSDQFVFLTTPLAAAITTDEVTGQPRSLAFLMYA